MKITLEDSKSKYPECNFCMSRKDVKEIRNPDRPLVVSICSPCISYINYLNLKK